MNNLNIFIKANKALAEGNYDEFINYSSEGIRWENVGGSILNGRAELHRYISSVYDGITFSVENTVQEDNYIVEFGKIVFKKEGESKKSSYCDVWKFKDGLISQVTSFVI
jgi:ketosteroid isomerase-like protein